MEQPKLKLELSQELSDYIRYAKAYGKQVRKGEMARAKDASDLAIAVLQIAFKPLYKKAVENQETVLANALQLLISRGKSEAESRAFLGLPVK